MDLSMSPSKNNMAQALLRKDDVSSAGRDLLIQQHLSQVNLIAHRIHCRLPACANLEDMVSSGILGLISAVDHFDPARSAKLETYAEYKIRGAIFDNLRGLDWGPRRLRQRAKQIQAAISSTEQQMQRSPSEEEIAEKLGLSIRSYRAWLIKIQGLDLLDLGTPEHGSENDSGKRRDPIFYVSGDEEESPIRLLERRELQRLLADAISNLPPLEKTVLRLYYYEEMTLLEISKVILRHESRVAQIKAQSILRLREYMREQWPNGRSSHSGSH
jgi:RNA polymerase sigma factor for flagellar operon FliA